MARKSSSLSKTFVWILLALLIVGLAGFGATNLGGRVNKIGNVGDEEILVTQYLRALQNEMRLASVQLGSPITFQQAQMLGIQQQALSRLVSEKTLDSEAQRMGISVGDETVRDQLLGIMAFQGIDGVFDRSAYSFSLENAGLKEPEFEAELRDETARSLLQKAIVTGNIMPGVYAEKTLEYLSEERSIAFVTLIESDLPAPLSGPTNVDLKTFYDANIADFSLPESKAITLAKLTPDMILGEIEVDDDDLSALYEKNIGTYKKPERRLVERLSFLDMASAVDAKQRLVSNETDFETLVSERGLELADIDMGDVSQEALNAAGEAVFALNPGDISAPLKSDLGPALFRVNGILAAQETTLEEASEELKIQLTADKARRMIDAEIARIEDLLAAGATLEDLSQETDMSLESIVYYNGVEADIAAYSAFRQAANSISESDFPEVIRLSDGGILAMRLDEIIAERPQDFETVRIGLEQAWKDDALSQALALAADEKIAAVKSGETLEAQGGIFQAHSDFRRDGFLPDTPPLVVSRAFELTLEDIDKIEGASEIYIVQLKGIKPGDTGTEIAANVKTRISEQLNQSLSNDIFQIYMSQVQQRATVAINEQSLNAVHNSFQ
jgi:peptidyl-prolyl cis-trans isomerase D